MDLGIQFWRVYRKESYRCILGGSGQRQYQFIQVRVVEVQKGVMIKIEMKSSGVQNKDLQRFNFKVEDL